jgi:hypothetical protein
MLRRLSCIVALLLAAAGASADTPADKTAVRAKAQANAGARSDAAAAKAARTGSEAKSGGAAKKASDDKTLSGMSILGNQEAPKALVIVPWKSSQLGDQVGLSKTLDDGRQPVDKDVFMRELEYYEIRSGGK